eukprot:CAMPEP_0113620644 /NCGR_PEP_ID=MMETSP0017_2-20120614/10526_1 /TAXON_ID=2856 /ORGANISM="Cylindrotheca closterium" /LENGTH=585 /DNA_ID=CAMNT_0000530325 /DNA_START=41 /DNA_END=1798 /DNA_ORIENTATION=- /assembly_acc=CAM_ASM_000147
MEGGAVANLNGNVDEIDNIDFDIDFDVNEAGRSIALGKYDSINESQFDTMNFGQKGTIRVDNEMNLGNFTPTTIGESRLKHTTDHQSTSRSEYQAQPSFSLSGQLESQRSAPRSIPVSTKQSVDHPQTSGSRPSSAGSTGTAFLNNILNPASTFNSTHLSHTPPTHVSTSYEVSHFGKRPRSGSISERLRVSSELEQKGMIDREQKGILKDLIISGDNELQDALDMYEQGDVTKLERILESGALSNRAMNDIDLLGDLDLDFLNVSDDHAGNGQHGNPSSYTVQPQTSFPNNTSDSLRQMSGLQAASDGIGDLDFDGGIDGNIGLAPMESYNREPSPVYASSGQRSRSNSTFSVDVDYRQRSNSLFSALIGTDPQEGIHSDYGRWMERSSENNLASQGGRRSKATRRASAPTSFQPVPEASAATSQNKRSGRTPAGGSKREIRAEEKRRERQEKKEKKEREKQVKKEKREQAKLEKLKKAEMEEKEEYQAGSGRPRSMSDPNLRTSVDANGLLQVDRPEGWIGAYSPESRKVRIARFLEKRNHRVWTKTVKYDVRKNFADSRLRVKGRFVKKEDELLMRELMSLT